MIGRHRKSSAWQCKSLSSSTQLVTYYIGYSCFSGERRTGPGCFLDPTTGIGVQN